MSNAPTHELEDLLSRGGVELIAGVDEAGRGPVAGPVTAAAVILPADASIKNVRDSKQLSSRQREMAAGAIKKIAIAFSVVHVPHDVIDSVNILNATRLAVGKCLEELEVVPQVVLIDGKFLNVRGRTCISITKGDSSVFSIAAASILAKTARDQLMYEYAKEFPQYSFERNKGYLTSAHLDAIRHYGLSPIHRRSFEIHG